MCDLHPRDEQSESREPGIVDFVDELVVAITNARIYWERHPRVHASIEALRAVLKRELGSDSPATLTIGASDGYLFHDGRPLIGASLTAQKILEPLATVGSGGLSFSNWASADDLFALIEVLGKQKLEAKNEREANRELEERGCTAIRFLPPYQESVDADADPDDEDDLPFAPAAPTKSISVNEPRIPINVYQDLVAHLQETMVQVCHGRLLNTAETKTFVEVILRYLRENPSRMMSMTRYERYDAYTFGHSIRVAMLSLNFATALTKDEDVLQRVGMAALLHDIGKARVPFEILHSTRRLSPEERQEMNRHTTHGGEILLDQEDPDPVSIATAFGHHRTIDQGGYPATLHDHRLSIATRIVKICDVYEALTAIRPYKDRMSPLRAYRIMMSMGRHFDLPLLRRYIEVNGIYPTGSRVELDGSMGARVVGQTSRMQFPIVELESERHRRIDLSRQEGSTQIRVTKLLSDHFI